MSHSEGQGERRADNNGLVAVAIAKVKSSQYAFKWALDNLLTEGQTVVLIHVFSASSDGGQQDIFLPFRSYANRKHKQCFEVLLEGHDMVREITDYVTNAAIETLVLGSRDARALDRPTSVKNAAPDFCTVYIIDKQNVSAVRAASRAAPSPSPLLDQIHNRERVEDTEVGEWDLDEEDLLEQPRDT